MLAFTDDHLTRDDDLVDVSRGRGVPNLIRTGSRGAYRVRSHDDEVRNRAVGDPAAAGPAKTAIARCTGDHHQIARRKAAAFTRGQPLVHLESAQLLERVDDGMLIRAQGQRTTRIGQPTGRADAVGKITFGCRTEACRGLIGAQGLDVAVGEMGGVYDSSAGIE